MKPMLKNITSSFFLKVVAVLFVLNFLFNFYRSIRLDSIDILLSGILGDLNNFMILYALGLLLKEKGNKN